MKELLKTPQRKLALITALLFSSSSMANCRNTVGAFVRTHSDLVHYPFIIPAVLVVISTLMEASEAWQTKIKSIITYGFLIWALSNNFLDTVLGWIAC